MDSKRMSLLVGCFLLGLAGCLRATSATNKCGFPAIFNFGDSNSDTGTFIPRPPNGCDFPGGPLAKRFSDGRLIIDFIAEELKLPYLTAYEDPTGTNYSHGANFAASLAPIRNGTTPSKHDLGVQVSYFIEFKSKALASPGDKVPKAEDFSKGLYTIDIGHNDLYVNYLKPQEQQLKEVSSMIRRYCELVEQLYKEGARNFWLHNTGPQGCLSLIALSPLGGPVDSDGCKISRNEIAKEFNKQLKCAVDELRKKLPLASFVYVDVFSAKLELKNNAKKLGFADQKDFCCGIHTVVDNMSCKPETKCEDPSKHIIWDGIHYTEKANQWVAKRIADGSLSDNGVPVGEACKSA